MHRPVLSNSTLDRRRDWVSPPACSAVPEGECLTNKLEATLNHAGCPQCCLANEGHSKPSCIISASHMQLSEATFTGIHPGFLVNDMRVVATEVFVGVMMD